MRQGLQRISSITLDGKMRDLQKPGKALSEGIGSETELAQYFGMPYQQFDGIECKSGRVQEARSALETTLRQAQNEQPGVSVKEVLFNYWGQIEAYNCSMPSGLMREICKTYLEGIRQLGLYEKLEIPVSDLQLA